MNVIDSEDLDYHAGRRIDLNSVIASSGEKIKNTNKTFVIIARKLLNFYTFLTFDTLICNMASKPLILSDSITLVDKDLTNVYRHWTKNGKETQLPCDVKFKKKEEVNTLGKALLKHRIYALTGKNLPTIENEMGQNLEKVEDLKCFAKILLHEAFEKLPKIAAPEPVGEPMDTSVPVNRRKRGFNDDSGSNGGEAEIEPSRKRGRKSIAVTPSSTPTR